MDDGTHPVLEILRLGSEHSCNAEWERSSWKSEGQPGERVGTGPKWQLERKSPAACSGTLQSSV